MTQNEENELILGDGKDRVRFRPDSFCKLLQWLMVEYLGISHLQAQRCLEEHQPYIEYMKSDFMAVCMESHSWPYYYLAMDWYCGDWHNANPILPPPNTADGLSQYQEIEQTILTQHHLQEPIEWL